MNAAIPLHEMKKEECQLLTFANRIKLNVLCEKTLVIKAWAESKVDPTHSRGGWVVQTFIQEESMSKEHALKKGSISKL